MSNSGRPAFLALASLLVLGACIVPRASAAETPAGAIQIQLDATDAPRALFRGQLRIPVRSGPLTLVYPKWIPGEHGPTGPITSFSGLEFSAAGKPVEWRRDPVDMYAFHVTVPEGADQLQVSFTFLGDAEVGVFTSGGSSTPNLAIISWNQFMLYPAASKSDDVMVAASLSLPRGWHTGTALESTSASADGVEYAPVSLTVLVDSPVLIGKYMRSIPLDSGDRPVVLDIVADSPEALAITPETTGQMKQLVREADAMFGARHFDRYHFLFTLSDHVAHFGLEHHQCNDSRVAERSLIDPDLAKLYLGVLSHEYAHSWNGKYRRPEDLATTNYQDPMQGDLLWVYEGLTTYLGNVLAARSGLWSPEYYREVLGYACARFGHMRGRDWRPLDDTCVAAQILYGAPAAWEMSRRSVDFYEEGWMMWTEVDTRIRELTKGKRSMDDVCRRFFGGESTPPRLVTYRLDDVLAVLNEVAPYDWRRFFDERVMRVTPGPPMDGIERGGWRLVYNDQKNLYLDLRENAKDPLIDAAYSIGLRVKPDGRVQDVVPESPAFKAGIGPGMNVVAVNGRRFSKDVFKEAIRGTAEVKESLTLLVENREFFTSCAVDYHSGLRIPHLERNKPLEDLIGRAIAAHAPAVGKGK